MKLIKKFSIYCRKIHERMMKCYIEIKFEIVSVTKHFEAQCLEFVCMYVCIFLLTPRRVASFFEWLSPFYTHVFLSVPAQKLKYEV